MQKERDRKGMRIENIHNLRRFQQNNVMRTRIETKPET